jgi:hypothetical protein
MTDLHSTYCPKYGGTGTCRCQMVVIKNEIPTFIDPRFADPTYGVTIEHATVTVTANDSDSIDPDDVEAAVSEYAGEPVTMRGWTVKTMDEPGVWIIDADYQAVDPVDRIVAGIVAMSTEADYLHDSAMDRASGEGIGR